MSEPGAEDRAGSSGDDRYDDPDAAQPQDGTRAGNVPYVRQRARAEDADDGTHDPSVTRAGAPRSPGAEPIPLERDRPRPLAPALRAVLGFALPLAGGILLDRVVQTSPAGALAGCLAGIVVAALLARPRSGSRREA